MKRYLPILVALLILLSAFGCSILSTGGEKNIVKYDIELNMVRKASDINQRYRAPVADTTLGGVARYAYEDDLFRSIWSATEAGWELTISNKSEKPIVIDWDDVVYYDVDNMTHKVLSSKTKFADKANEQEPTLIARRGTINEKLSSATHIYQSPVYGFTKRPLFPIDFSEAIRYKNKEFKLMIPFTVDGLSAQYEFVFKIKDVKQELSATDPWAAYLTDRALGTNF